MIDREQNLVPLTKQPSNEVATSASTTTTTPDLKATLAGGEKAVAQIVMATNAGMTTEEFEKIVADCREVRHRFNDYVPLATPANAGTLWIEEARINMPAPLLKPRTGASELLLPER